MDSEKLPSLALETGFDFAGLAPAGPAPRASAFARWLARGDAGGLAWLARDPDRRADLRAWQPSARSVLVVGLGYAVAAPDPACWNDPRRGRVARYAWGPDYHERMGAMLRRLAEHVRREAGWTDPPPIFLDTAPVLERDWAAAAGLGFQGRSAMFIQPEFGTCTWLGGIALPVELPIEWPAARSGQPEPAAAAQREWTCPPECGQCLRSCPTGALCEPYRLDARRCLSYYTIEHRGVIPAVFAGRMHRWIFGCDACQENCPWNGPDTRRGGASWIAFDPERHAPVLEDVLRLTESEFRNRYRDTPVWRAKWSGFIRNAVAAIAARGLAEERTLLERVAAGHPHPLVRAQAQAALSTPADSI
ncbi:MAG: tRNA epoxyqueuosine(34) reductase QueG [Kiritimatiellae bacterium]|nr:tRNA epoxyqueuosine(34) reductase QueG [Kiritimatiellia bacterium]